MDYLTDVGMRFSKKNAKDQIQDIENKSFSHEESLSWLSTWRIKNWKETLLKDIFLEYESNFDCFIDENGNDVKFFGGKKTEHNRVILSSIQKVNCGHKLI